MLVGEHDLDRPEKNQRTHSVAEIVIHPDYGNTQYIYDKDIGNLVYMTYTIIFLRLFKSFCIISHHCSPVETDQANPVQRRRAASVPASVRRLHRTQDADEWVGHAGMGQAFLPRRPAVDAAESG